MHHMLRTGANINQGKLQKQKVQPFYEICLFIDRTIQADKSDITIKCHKEKICKLIDFTFPMDKVYVLKNLNQNIKIL